MRDGMKKSKLIKMLQQIEGDPDIAIWNGFAGDYQHIEPTIVPLELRKIKRSKLKSILEFQHKNKITGEYLDEVFKRYELETVNEFFTEEEIKDYYGYKKVIYLLEPKLRNKSSWDRTGNINY